MPQRGQGLGRRTSRSVPKPPAPPVAKQHRRVAGAAGTVFALAAVGGGLRRTFEDTGSGSTDQRLGSHAGVHIPCRPPTVPNQPPLWRWDLKPGAEATVCLAGHSSLEPNRNLTITALSALPAVYHVADFLLPYEVDAIWNFAEKKLQLHPTNSKWRKSAFVNLPVDRDHSVSRKMAQLLRLSPQLFDVSLLQLQRYNKDQFYHPHYDSCRLDQLNASLPDDFPGGPKVFPNAARYVTLILYLSDGGGKDLGGDTYFPFAGLDDRLSSEEGWDLAYAVSPGGRADGLRDSAKMWQDHCTRHRRRGIFVPPKRGSMVFFYNHFTDSAGRLHEMDVLSFHGSCPATVEKRMANFWVSVPPELFSTEKSPGSAGCTDHDWTHHQCRDISHAEERQRRSQFKLWLSGDDDSCPA